MTTTFPFRGRFWIEDRTRACREPVYFCRRADLELALADAGVPENTIRLRLGASHYQLGHALDGARLDARSVALLEAAIFPS